MHLKLCVCVCAHTRTRMCMQGSTEARHIGSPRTGVTGCHELPNPECLDPNSGPLPDQYTLFTVEPSPSLLLLYTSILKLVGDNLC